MSVPFERLVGVKLLDGVEYGLHVPAPQYPGEEPEAASCLKFRLDGVTYISYENPSDGYRSSMRSFEISDEPPRYTFPPTLVSVSVSEKDAGGTEQELLVITDFFTEKVVLETGTHNTSDYYPCYVASWYPHHLVMNASLPTELKRTWCG